MQANSSNLTIDRVAEILGRCGSADTVMLPTMLYNEGWMLRLVLDWFSRQPPGDHVLSFEPQSRWYSEALLPSQFLARTRGDLLAESWTHADGAIGHFHVGANGRGDLQLLRDARQLVITEAKMFSGLSAGTRRAPTFDQAARNVACIAEVLRRAERPPQDCPRLGFVVLAPAEQVATGMFAALLSKSSIAAKVQDRYLAYGGEKDAWYRDWFEPTLRAVHVTAVSWEDVIAFVGNYDPGAASILGAFLRSCLSFNRPMRSSPERA